MTKCACTIAEVTGHHQGREGCQETTAKRPGRGTGLTRKTGFRRTQSLATLYNTGSVKTELQNVLWFCSWLILIPRSLERNRDRKRLPWTPPDDTVAMTTTHVL